MEEEGVRALLSRPDLSKPRKMRAGMLVSRSLGLIIETG